MKPVCFSNTWLPAIRWVVLTVLSLLCATGGISRALGSVVINEFVASNRSGLLDEDGETSDWIELHNTGVTAVQLEGWYLTDDPALPTRWRCPAGVLDPGGYRVVFASGKDRRDGSRWHTNFRLSSGGGYLALVQPDGKTISNLGQTDYPPQRDDISYGRPAGTTTRNLLADVPVRVLVPRSAGELPSDWAQPSFEPGAGWLSFVGFGLGYDGTPDNGGATNNLARGGAATQSSTGNGLEAGLAVDGNLASFTHTTSVDNASSWTLDLGKTFELRRVVLRNRADCCQSRLRDIKVSLLGEDGRTEVWNSGLLNPENALGSPAAITIDFFDLNLGAINARHIRVTRVADPDLSGSGGLGNADEDNVLSLAEVEAYGVDQISYARWIRGDLDAAMRGQNASAFVRAPLVVESLESLSSLVLRLRRDDGVVVWLNGQRILERDGPSTTAWNSAATQKRAKEAALQAEDVDLLALRSSLQPGTNWLAFQSLNASADDSDLLLHAEAPTAEAGGGRAAYLLKPTPGLANVSAWNLGRVADTKLSHGRGFYSAPFDLTLSTSTAGAQIRYTLDGSLPTPNTGLLYVSPIPIRRTTAIRVAAFKTDYEPTDVDTHTLVLLESTIAQTAQQSGFPMTWAGVSADYAMDTRITRSAVYSGSMSNSLRSIPTLSIVAATDDLFGASRGIYANPERGGIDWERAASIEWLGEGESREFQEDCGLRIQGGYFRARGVTRKHSLRLLFKGEYGAGRLREDLFGTFGAAREFDTLVLRAGANDGYAWDAAKDTEQFTRDQFGRELFEAMGQVSTHGRFVHVYLNGLYWGLYNLTERPAEDFSATYYGGVAEDWDAINAGDVKNGNLNGWNSFLSVVRTTTTTADYLRLKGLGPDGRANASFTNYLDAPNYQDYMLLNIWGGNWDWPNKNFWFGWDRTGKHGGFKFYLWDFENTMGNNRDRSPLNMVSPRAGVVGSWVGEPHERLKRNSEYRVEFGDRVHKHFFGTGALTPSALVARYGQIARGVEAAVIAETARWGDEHFSPPQDLEDWRRERDWLLGTYLPQRTAVVLGQLRASGLYPRVAAPLLIRGPGEVPTNMVLRIQSDSSEVFYTTNGMDPRLPGGAVNPEAIRVGMGTGGDVTPVDPDLILTGRVWRYLDNGTNPGEGWNVPAFDDATWKTGASPLGYGDNDEATVVGFVDSNPATAGVQKNATTYFRTRFQVATPGAFDRLRVALTYDDAAAVYLNGQLIHRTANLPSTASYNTYATGQVPDNTVETLEDIPMTFVRAGENVMAVEVHQSDSGSSDISFDLELAGVPKASGAGMNTATLTFTTQPLQLKTRARQGTEWSALAEGLFLPDTVGASNTTLVVSELCFRPFDPTNAVERAISGDRDDYEFIELLNIGSKTVDLSGVRFNEGVLFTFGAGTLIGAGERVVLVSNRAAFEARYGRGIRVIGEYQGRLDNAGEWIAIVDTSGAEVRRFRYNDKAPWPALADRGGYTLLLRNPELNPDHANPIHWRASVAAGGNPGGSDSERFKGDPVADANANGQADLMDYALGVGLSASGSEGLKARVDGSIVAGERVAYLVISFPRNVAADDALLSIETAPTPLGPWRVSMEQFERVDERVERVGMVREWWRSMKPVDQATAAYVRLSVRR